MKRVPGDGWWQLQRIPGDGCCAGCLGWAMLMVVLGLWYPGYVWYAVVVGFIVCFVCVIVAFRESYLKQKAAWRGGGNNEARDDNDEDSGPAVDV